MNQDEKKEETPPPPPSKFKIIDAVSSLNKLFGAPDNFDQGDYDRCSYWATSQILNLLIQVYACDIIRIDDKQDEIPISCMDKDCLSMLPTAAEITHYYTYIDKQSQPRTRCNQCFSKKSLTKSFIKSVSTITILNSLLKDCANGADVDAIHRCTPIFNIIDHENGVSKAVKWNVDTISRPPIPTSSQGDAAKVIQKWVDKVIEIVSMGNDEMNKLQLHAITVDHFPNFNSKPHCMMVQELQYDGHAVCINSWGDNESNPRIHPRNILKIHSIKINDMKQIKNVYDELKFDLNLTPRGYEHVLSHKTPAFIRELSYQMIDMYPSIRDKVNNPSTDDNIPSIDVAKFATKSRLTPNIYYKYWQNISPLSKALTNINIDVLEFLFTLIIQNGKKHEKQELKGRNIFRLHNNAATDIGMIRFDTMTPSKPSNVWYNSKNKAIENGIRPLINSLLQRYFDKKDRRSVHLMLQFIFKAWAKSHPQTFNVRFIPNPGKDDRGIYEFFYQPNGDLNELSDLKHICIRNIQRNGGANRDAVFTMDQIIDKLSELRDLYKTSSNAVKKLVPGFIRQEYVGDLVLPQMIQQKILNFTNSFVKSKQKPVSCSSYCGSASPTIIATPLNDKSAAHHSEMMPASTPIYFEDNEDNLDDLANDENDTVHSNEILKEQIGGNYVEQHDIDLFEINGRKMTRYYNETPNNHKTKVMMANIRDIGYNTLFVYKRSDYGNIESSICLNARVSSYDTTQINKVRMNSSAALTFDCDKKYQPKYQ